MPLPTNAPLPDDLVVNDGYVLVFDAVDPADGSAVTGVVVTDVTVQGDDGGLQGIPNVGNPLLLGIG